MTKSEKMNQEKRAKRNAYSNKYIKSHYLRKEVKLNREEAELLNLVLNDKKMTFKEYVMNNLKKDSQSIEF